MRQVQEACQADCTLSRTWRSSAAGSASSSGSGSESLMTLSNSSFRRLADESIISDSPPLPALLADDALLERHVRDNVQSAWHASCTCRMGDPADPQTVVDPHGRVVGADNLFIADASVMPEVSRTNTNIPTIMIAERIAERVRQR